MWAADGKTADKLKSRITAEIEFLVPEARSQKATQEHTARLGWKGVHFDAPAPAAPKPFRAEPSARVLMLHPY
jgi:hypothetical protein